MLRRSQLRTFLGTLTLLLWAATAAICPPLGSRLTETLLRLLRRRGFRATLPGSAGQDAASAPVHAGAYRVQELVLLQPTLLGSERGA